ncbi:MAG TPA: DUF2094 domain-containing protein [Desulfuromonadales bacterium]|nr:DUF2094 domain-containing protein [Desulfuromonadales bacterium]
MLTHWQWVACGKHPAAKDYIRIGDQFTLGTSLFSWVEQGYDKVRHDMSGRFQVSWKFWLNGTMHDRLACGVLLESGDAIGRPYPLLLMGSGTYRQWGKCWENLPLACETTWNSAMVLFSNKLTTIPELEMGLGMLPSPDDILLDDTLPPALPLKPLSGDMESEFCLYSLETDNGSGIEVAAAMRLSLLLKKRNAAPPVAVFIGGGKTAYMAVMRRPLKSLDFVTLWNLQ